MIARPSAGACGATEEFSMVRVGNEIVCVDRMDHSTIHDAHRHTVLARSADNGSTWSAPEPVASSSVTPHLVRLDSGVVALVFGRPGVHVQFRRGDSGPGRWPSGRWAVSGRSDPSGHGVSGAAASHGK